MHLLNHRSHNSTYLVLLPQETPSWLCLIAHCPMWHITDETYLLLLTCYMTEITHIIWMFRKTVLLQVSKMTEGNTTGNSRALVPYDVQPDQVVSHYAITPHAGRTIVPRQTRDNTDRPQGSATGSVARTHTASQASVRDDGTMAGLESDEENDNDLKEHRSKLRAILTTAKGNHSKSQAITTTTTYNAEYVSDPRAAQESEHQDKGEATIDPQDDPQDVNLKGGATNDSQDPDPRIPDLEANPLNSDPDSEAQVNPQPLPAISHEAGTPIDGIEAEEHEMDKQSHSGHDPETQIQIPIPEIPGNWQPPTTSHIERELGPNPLSRGPDLASTRCTVWRPSNPSGTPEFDENGVILGIDSDDEGNSCPQGSRQGNIEEGTVEEDGKMPRLVRDPQNQNPYAPLADDSDDEEAQVDISHHNSADDATGEDARTYTSVASSNSGSDDAGEQPSWAKLTPLPDSGMCQWRSVAGTKVHKRERTPKSKRTPNARNTATPNSIASIATSRDVCGDILSPVVGRKHEHNSSEEATPTDSNGSETDKKPSAQPDIEEGVQVKESKIQETEINMQSSSSSSHQPIWQRTRLRSTSHEREARLASDG